MVRKSRCLRCEPLESREMLSVSPVLCDNFGEISSCDVPESLFLAAFSHESNGTSVCDDAKAPMIDVVLEPMLVDEFLSESLSENPYFNSDAFVEAMLSGNTKAEIGNEMLTSACGSGCDSGCGCGCGGGSGCSGCVPAVLGAWISGDMPVTYCSTGHLEAGNYTFADKTALKFQSNGAADVSVAIYTTGITGYVYIEDPGDFWFASCTPLSESSTFNASTTVTWRKPDGLANDDSSIDRDFTFVYFVDVNGDRKHGGDEPSIPINIHIGYAEVWAFADQPYQEMRVPQGEVFDPAKRVLPRYNGVVGHASWEIIVDQGSIPLLKRGIEPQIAILDTYANKKLGFWPEGLLNDSSYETKPDSHYSAKKGWEIGIAGLYGALQYTYNVKNRSETWTYSNNCVSKTIDAVRAAGIGFDCAKTEVPNLNPFEPTPAFYYYYTVGIFGEALIAAGGVRM